MYSRPFVDRRSRQLVWRRVHGRVRRHATLRKAAVDRRERERAWLARVAQRDERTRPVRPSSFASLPGDRHAEVLRDDRASRRRRWHRALFVTSSARGRSTGIDFVDLHRLRCRSPRRGSRAYSATNSCLPVGDSARPTGSAPTCDRCIDGRRAAIDAGDAHDRAVARGSRRMRSCCPARCTTLAGVAAGRDLRDARVVGGLEHRQRASSGLTIATCVPSSD